MGETAYIVHHPPDSTPIRSLPSYATLQAQKEFPGSMLAPLVTQDVLDFYDQRRITPIVIYPEVFDNPFNAPLFGRYILNYPGKLNTKYAQREDFSFCYTKILADHCVNEFPDHPKPLDILFVPTSDLDFWNAQGAAEERQASCYYAGKLRDIHGKLPDNVPPGSVEILRAQHMTTAQVRDIFRRSEAFYCYEDTALAIEAQLCGCPTVFVPNEHFSGFPLGSFELGNDGSCVLGEPDGLSRATGSVGTFEHTIRKHIQTAPFRIVELAAKLKALAATKDYQGSICYPFEPRLVFFDQSPLTPIAFEIDHEPNNMTLQEPVPSPPEEPPPIVPPPKLAPWRRVVDEIARNIWVNRQRLGWRTLYKIGIWGKSCFASQSSASANTK